MLNEILQYQEKDAQLVKIEKDLEVSPQKRNVNKLVEQVKQAQNKLVALENLANDLVAEFEKLNKQYELEQDKLEQIQNESYEGKSEEELGELESTIKRQISALLSLNKKIKELSNKITETVKDFDKTKNTGIECKEKYKESMEQYNKFSAKKVAEKEKVMQQMKELQSKIDAKIMARYLQMRDDHKFPILVPLVNNACGVCSMTLPSARLDLLKQKGVIECENCHRLIYQKDGATQAE